MSIRMIASVVIAALLMTGGVATASQVTEYGVQPTLKATLTKEEAKTIALEHAGLTESQVTGLRIEYDAERATAEWDIDFRSGDWEYDYEVNAETGAVIKGEKEYDPERAAKPTEPAPAQPAEAQPAEVLPAQTEAPKKLSAEEAKNIALKHAGLTEAEFLRTEYDVDDGRHHWDVEFHSGDWEYDYEIHAETGEIFKSEKEYDPVKALNPSQPPKTETPKTETTKKIAAEEAKNIALKHAGLKASQVKGLRAKYDVDDGIPEWEVEFYADGLEYDYEIHAESGKIRSWDKERDD